MTVLQRALCAFLWLQSGAVAGQAPPFRAEIRLVRLQATVTNSHNELVTNLDQRQFTVQENGKRQSITIFRRDDVPISLGLLIDNSGSMRPLRQKVEAAALAFARASNPDDEIFVINFADKIHLDVPMTGDLNVLEAGIGRVDSIGGTALRDAVDSAERYLGEHATRERRILLVITDGKDNASIASPERIRQHAEQSQTTIHAIGLFKEQENGGAGRHELTEMTERTGGMVYFPASVEQVEAVAVNLAHQIRNQYTIGYAPLNQALDGSYRSIHVSVSGDHYTVHTRSGYRAVPAVPSVKP
jgi:VWFA-related protein